MASLAEPALDPDAVDLGLIFGLARVEAVTDEGVRRATAWTLFRTGKSNGLEMGEVVLDSGTKIRYDRHAFSAARPGGVAAKLNPPGRVSPFWRNERPSLLDFAPGCQSRPARGRWPPGDWPSPGTPCPDLTQRFLVTKRPPTMDDPTLDADLDHHLFKTNSRESRPINAAAYSKTKTDREHQRSSKRLATGVRRQLERSDRPRASSDVLARPDAFSEERE